MMEKEELLRLANRGNLGRSLNFNELRCLCKNGHNTTYLAELLYGLNKTISESARSNIVPVLGIFSMPLPFLPLHGGDPDAKTSMVGPWNL